LWWLIDLERMIFSTFFGVSLSNIILFIFLSFFLSFFLYFFREKDRFKDIPKKIILCMFLLRLLSFFGVFILLLNPFFKKKEKISVDPVLVFFQDNSNSLINNSDSVFYKEDYIHSIDSIKNIIQKDINLDFLLFGEKVRKGNISFSDQSTNLSDVFDYAENIYSDQDVAAFVVLSDGIFNQGSSPLFLSNNLNAPVYCLALGDTSIAKDVSIVSINHNELGFPGNDLPVEVFIKSDHLKGEKIKVTVKDDSQSVVFEDVIFIDDNNFVESLRFYVSSQVEGLKKFDVHVTLISDVLIIEKNEVNNLESFYINLVEKKKNILILYSTPHPDISAIINSIKKDEEYNVQSIFIKEFFEKDFTSLDPDLLILHQMPSEERLPFDIFENNLPIWFINGPNSDLDFINDLDLGLTFSQTSSSYNHTSLELPAQFNTSFQKFTFNDSTYKMIEDSPPLFMYSNPLSFSSNVDVLLNTKSRFQDDLELLFFGRQLNDEKYAMLNAEGIWRWKLFNFQKNKNHYNFNEFIIKIVKNLLIDDNQDRFRINYPSLSYYGESLILNSELYDENLEKTSQGIIDLVLTKDENTYNYNFTCVENDYFLDLGKLEPGIYNFIANASLGDYNFSSKKGSFVVNQSFFEKQLITANHKLLYDIAQLNGGKAYSIKEINQFSLDLMNLKNIIKKEQIDYSYKSIFDFILILLIILFLLFLEWILRKRHIGY